MAKVTLPYTIVNGAANDGVPVQGNFNALLAGINTIDTEQLNGAIVGLANLTNAVKVIESVTHTPLTADYSLTNVETTIFSQSITPSAQRYCLFLLSGRAWGQEITAGCIGYQIRLYDTTTQIKQSEINGYYGGAGSLLLPFNLIACKQLSSGAHTIYIKGLYTSNSIAVTVNGDANGVYTSLITIVFAF